MVSIALAAAFVAVTNLVTSAVPVTKDDSAVIPARCDRSGAMRIAVAVEGTEPRVFILDTGSSLGFIDQRIASALRLPAAGRIASGQGVASLVGVKLTIAGIALPPMSMVSGDPTGLNDVLSRSDAGILGNDALRALGRVTVDQAKCRLIVGETKVQGRHALVRLDWHQGRPVVTIPGAGRLLLDSGATMMTVFEGSTAAATFRGSHGAASLVKIQRISGDAVARLGFIPSLAVGAVELSNVPALAVRSWYENDPAAPEGLLPLAIFSSVYFNSVEGYAILIR
jgi:hypothetical protein